MEKKVRPIPEGFHSVNPDLVVKNGAQAIEFYKKAFDATEVYRKQGPDGRLMHAIIRIGDSVVMLADECPSHPGHEHCPKSPATLRGTTGTLFLYAEDVDKVFGQALHAGAIQVRPVEDMFWGDRCATVMDPSGHSWTIATHTEDVSPKEMEERANKFFAAQNA